jgi:hypothetical protein
LLAAEIGHPQGAVTDSDLPRRAGAHGRGRGWLRRGTLARADCREAAEDQLGG